MLFYQRSILEAKDAEDAKGAEDAKEIEEPQILSFVSFDSSAPFDPPKYK